MSVVDAVLASAGQPRYILLKNDRVQFGNVRIVSRFIEVELGKDSKVSLAQDQVAFVGESLESMYQFKKTGVPRWATGDHLQFGHWCLRNGLLEHAIEHYLQIDKRDKSHPKVKLLGVELENRVLADDSFRRMVGLPPNEPSKPAASAGRTTLTESKSFNTQSPSNVMVVTANSEGTLEAVHPEVARYFQERVQPILINRCSQSACHGVSSTSAFRLIEPKGKSRARISSENLKSALGQLQLVNGNAKLVMYATQPHGLQTEAGISPTEAHLVEELRRWIRFVENPVATAGGVSNPIENEMSAAARLTQIVPGTMQLQSVPKQTASSPDKEAPAKPSMREIDELEAQLNRALAEDPSHRSQSTSGDPFDPAEFNRQVSQQKSAKNAK
jgi:hypothetical protein